MREAEALRLQVHQMSAIRKVYELSKRITMNENLNLVEILKDCPKGTKLYSTVYGEVGFVGISTGEFPVKYVKDDDSLGSATAQGLLLSCFDGECTLFPSKDQRDWSKFNVKKPKFDPKTLKPFDKVLARDGGQHWCCDLFSHIVKNEATYPYLCVGSAFECCIPYNDDTKHLVGTNEEAPEYYRYWED